MSPLLLCSVFILMLTCTFTWAGQNFVNVTDCPKDANEWELKSKMKNCYGDTPDYLCAAIENMLGQYGEICTKKRWIPENKCAVLNAQTHNLDSVDCKADIGCPPNMILSSEVWRYKICFENFYGITKTLADKTTQTNIIVDERTKTLADKTTQTNIIVDESEPEAESGDPGPLAGIIIIVITLALIGSLVIVYILDKRFNWGLRDSLRTRTRAVVNGMNERIRSLRNNRIDRGSVGKKDDNEDSALMNVTTGTDGGAAYEANDTYMEPFHRVQVLNEQFSWNNKDVFWKLTALRYYLVVTLKHFIGIDELKDATVLFKTSLFQHFKESILKELYDINSWDDYAKLDISLVYNLLRNVCKHIPSPTRGWGYDPPSDDVNLGADIERIRSIWNIYCDSEANFMHLDDIFVRMFDRFGKISEDVEVQDSGSEKIMSVELNPECTVHDRVVLTKAIKQVLSSLNKETIVIVKGAMGSGKSTCLKYVDEHYRGNQWEVKWKEKFITLGDLHVQENKKILLCCDNLFGAYNRGQFALTSEIIEALENPGQEGGGKLKVVLAIHDHVYDELQKSLNIKALQNKSVVIDVNEFSDAEMLLIFNDQRKRGHCTRDLRCWFRNVDFRSLHDALKENPGKIGDPLLTLLYSNFHNLFSENGATQNIVRELCTIYQNMLDNSPELFHILLYIMMVGDHEFKKKLPDWAAELGGINNKNVEKNVCHLDAFLVGRIDGQRLQLKHDIFSFALFKFCANHTKFQSLLLQHCQFLMIEEIMRPVSSPAQSDFCVILKSDMFPVLVSRIVGQNLHMFMKSHPLMDNLEFKDLLKNKSSPDVWKTMISN